MEFLRTLTDLVPLDLSAASPFATRAPRLFGERRREPDAPLEGQLRLLRPEARGAGREFETRKLGVCRQDDHGFSLKNGSLPQERGSSKRVRSKKGWREFGLRVGLGWFRVGLGLDVG